MFSCDAESHRVYEYHWLWFGFMDSELAALSKSRRVVSAREATLSWGAERQLQV